MTVLLVGGCGFIGRQIAWALSDSGHAAVVLDDFSSGSAAYVPPGVRIVEGDVRDRGRVRDVLVDHSVRSVIHLAGSISVEESVAFPGRYYGNNTGGVAALVDACLEVGVDQIVFSSTAAVYGAPRSELVDERHATHPVSPYGHSKLLAESILRGATGHSSLRPVILRYFNVAGADPDGRTGQTHPGASHLIINALRVAQGRAPALRVFGNDYDTIDGTGVRDFIHVADLAQAHISALTYLDAGGTGGTFNCGYGKGYSVLEVVSTAERVTGRSIPHVFAPRRDGDIASMVADPSQGQSVLGWSPQHDSLEDMIRSAWEWELTLNDRRHEG